ncbi:hypothetical protein [Sphingobacterium chungjuense]|uniref:hypothetical protein n=1 Tax=Sphingobacterium chungjuense TaxID=2675553 RepID=UPI001407C09B|nr:hypothetical protein [Sphingobacterium chungjuense]
MIRCCFLQSGGGIEGSFGTGLVDDINGVVANIILRNETGAEMVLADTIQNPIYLQRFALRDHENHLSPHLGIQIPVEISITDVL